MSDKWLVLLAGVMPRVPLVPLRSTGLSPWTASDAVELEGEKCEDSPSDDLRFTWLRCRCVACPGGAIPSSFRVLTSLHNRGTNPHNRNVNQW
jgi:hypothetical protein